MSLKGWKKFAVMILDKDDKIDIKPTGDWPKHANLVYGWRTQEEWLRFGTAQSNLKKRITAYKRDINKSFAGNHKPTPLEEAKKWKRLLLEHGQLTAYFHIAEEVETIVGFVSPYLNIEKELIKKFNTREKLNRSHR